jgi:regulator of sirC expression with transglutaminase-like and TPR domain
MKKENSGRRVFALIIFVLLGATLVAAHTVLVRREGVPYVDRLLSLREDQISLDLVALSLSKGSFPNLKIRAYRQKIDGLAREVQSLAGGSENPEARINALNAVLFQREGYTYDPDVSAGKKKGNPAHLNTLLDTKRGTCLTLPLLYMSVAQRLRYPIRPVMVPGHCFLRYLAPDSRVINIEATARGESYPDDFYIHALSVEEKSLKIGSYMRTLSYREYLAVIVDDSATAFNENGAVGRAVDYEKTAVQLDPLCAGCYRRLNSYSGMMSIIDHGPAALEAYSLASESGKKYIELGYVDLEDTSYWKLRWKT